FDQLALGSCVFGLNSTAFLEAAVANRPCLTVVADEFWAAQGRTGHFRHLLRGGFLEVAGTIEEAAQRIARIVESGVDQMATSRPEFLRWFLRPCGLDRPASQVVADVIERSAIPFSSLPMASATDPIPGLTLRSEAIGR